MLHCPTGNRHCHPVPLVLSVSLCCVVQASLTVSRLIKRSGEMPDITLEAFTDGSFAAWGKDMQMFWEVWQALTFGGCIVVGGLCKYQAKLVDTDMTTVLTVLNKPRTSLFSVEKRVYRRLTSLVMEAM